MYRQITKFILIASTTTVTLIGFASLRNASNSQAVGNKENKRPNIVLIVADDMGYSDLSMYGGEVPTPNIESLAKSGMILNRFHGMPSCSPSRSVLLSGTDNHQAGVGTMDYAIRPNQKGKPGYEGYLNDRVAPISSVLKDAGYHTYMVGKWHLGDKPNYLPSDRGFEQSFALLQGEANHYIEMPVGENRGLPKYVNNGKPVNLPKNFYSTDYYTDKLVEYIDRDRNSGQPFFIYAAYTSPHIPFQAPQKYIQKYLGKYDMGWDKLREQRFERQKKLGIIPPNLKLPPRLAGVPAWDDLTPEQKRYESKRFTIYAAMIDNLDYNVGRLIDHLKKIGEYDNTVFVFISDNGPEGFDRKGGKKAEEWMKQVGIDNSYENMGNPNSLISVQAAWAQVSATPLLGYKEHLSEGGFRVPAIFSYPKVIKTGSRSEAMTFVRDIKPTLLDLAQVQHPGETYNDRRVFKMQGKSMRPVLEGKIERLYDDTDPIGFELTLNSADSALFLGDWKLLRISLPPFGDGQWKLFNLRTDPTELNDLSKQEPERLAAMIFLYKQYEQANGIIPAVTNPQTSGNSLPRRELQTTKR